MDFVKEPQDGTLCVAISRPSSAAECVNLQDRSLGTRATCIGPFRAEFELSVQQKAILQRMSKFYTPEVIDAVLRPALSSGEDSDTRNVSLRLLDWLTVNYSKKYNLVTHLEDGSVFPVYSNYRIALAHYRCVAFE
jgi:hypothetical protein